MTAANHLHFSVACIVSPALAPDFSNAGANSAPETSFFQLLPFCLPRLLRTTALAKEAVLRSQDLIVGLTLRRSRRLDRCQSSQGRASGGFSIAISTASALSSVRLCTTNNHVNGICAPRFAAGFLFFKHTPCSLVDQIIYGTLLAERRLRLHLRARST